MSDVNKQPHFDEHTHGMSIMYRDDGDRAMTVTICDHVDHLRAIALLCMAVHGVSKRDGVPSAKLLEVLTDMMPDFEEMIKARRQ